jgi:hypothetical protein
MCIASFMLRHASCVLCVALDYPKRGYPAASVSFDSWSMVNRRIDAPSLGKRKSVRDTSAARAMNTALQLNHVLLGPGRLISLR